MPESTIFWDVDTQADFMGSQGKLYVPGAENIVPNLKTLTDWAGGHGMLIVASACAHQPGDPEFAHYPPHCLVGTAGQEKIPETRLPNPLIVPNRPVPLPSDLYRYPQVVIEKQQLDVFTNPNIEAILARIEPVGEVVLYGVVTEICVARAARGLISRGYQLSLVTDAIRHLDDDKAQNFLEEATSSGAALVKTEEVIAELKRRAAA